MISDDVLQCDCTCTSCTEVQFGGGGGRPLSKIVTCKIYGKIFSLWRVSSIYTVSISFCLFVSQFVCPRIIPRELLDQFASNFDWGTRLNHRNVLCLVKSCKLTTLVELYSKNVVSWEHWVASLFNI